MGQVRDQSEANAVARARNAFVVVAVFYAALYGLLTWALGNADPDPSGATAVGLALARLGQRLVLIFAVVFGGIAVGLHFVSTIAWGLGVAMTAIALFNSVTTFVEHQSVAIALSIGLELWIAGRLLAGDAVRAFLRVGARAAAQPEPVEDDEPVFRLPTVTPFPLAQPAVEAPVAAPKPAAAFDYYG